MAASIEDLLNALESPSSGQKMSPKKFWDKLANGEEWDEMGFDNEEEFDQFMEDNPYADI